MARRSEHTQEQIKEMVLKAAENIVIEFGFKALTARKIALEIGYTVGSIYMVFANMDDLITHIKGRTLDELAEQLQHSDQYNSVEEHIQALAGIYLRFAQQHLNRWRMIFDAQGGEPVPDWYQQKVEQLLVIVEQLFQQLRPHHSAELSHLAARALWSGVHGVCMLSLNGNLGRLGVKNADSAVRMLVENFIRGWEQQGFQADATLPKK